MGNCLVTKLKESVDNDALNFLGYLKVYLGPFSPAGYSYKAFRYNPITNSKPSGKVLDGTIYSDTALTIPITTLPGANFSTVRLFMQPSATPTILLDTTNIWAFGSSFGNIVSFGEIDATADYFYVNFDDLARTNVSMIALTYASFNRDMDYGDTTIENLIKGIFSRIKADGLRTFENTSNHAFYPCIVSKMDGPIASQARMTFHGTQFYNKRLLLSTEIDNNICHVYNTFTDSGSSGYLVSDEVATYNAATGVWTYI